jgi:glycosyltransferase involved in cell wall biosynthesis
VNTSVSIVIPAHNAARFIGQAIGSVFLQREAASILNLDVIVVDNASTDATCECVQRDFGSKVRLLHEPKPGAAYARNTGIATATSPLIAFLDADDLWLPGKLAEQFAALTAHPDVSLVFCHGAEYSDPPATYPCNPESRPFVHPSGLLARREAFDIAGPLPEFRCGEFIAWYGWTQTLGLKSLVVPGSFVRRRVHTENTTRNRQGLAEYTQAMHWLMERRRAHAGSAAATGAAGR